MKRKFYWFLMNGLFAAAVYLAYFQRVEGAERVAVFWAWANAVLSLGYCTDKAKALLKTKSRSVPKWIDISYDLCILAIFVWFGAIATGAAYLFHFILHTAAWEEATKET